MLSSEGEQEQYGTYIQGSEDEDNYRNEALEDFPSDADIVSYEQTPRRAGEASVLSPFANGNPLRGNSNGNSYLASSMVDKSTFDG